MIKFTSLSMWALLALIAVCITAHTPLSAAPPKSINYQGTLTNAGGTPVNGTVSMLFSLYNAQTGLGPALWTEAQATVSVVNGAFNTVLGASPAPPITLPFDVPYWLGVQVNADPEMTPRQPLSSVPYAYRAMSLEPGTAISASSLTATGNIITSAGNIVLPNPSAPGVGNIVKGGNRFIHNFGVGNTFIGELAGNLSMTGQNNTGAGLWALRSNAAGNANTATGANTLSVNNAGSSNTATGTFALESNTTGNMNTATGVDALQKNISGNNNTATGVQALFTNFGGNDNTATGAFALQANFFGSKNTATGSLALNKNTSGSNNTAHGWNALGSNTTGIRNTAMGESAMFANTMGNDNTASGISALAVNTTGAGNTASGSGALLLNTTGSNNTANGSAALGQGVAGSGNTAIGKGALYNAGKSETAGALVTGGSYTIQTTGTTDFTLVGAANSNPGTVFVATGTGTGSGTVSGNASGNIAIGENTGGFLLTGNNNILIGNVGGQSTESDTVRIGGSQTRLFLGGINVVASGAGLVTSGGQIGILPSSGRYKENVANMANASSGLMALRPVTFEYNFDKNPAGRAQQYGLIAEEVAQVYPDLVTRAPDGKIETVMYQYLPPMLLNELQKQQRALAAQAAELAVARALMGELARELKSLKAKLGGE